MTDRKLSEAYEAKTYIEGYLHREVLAGRKPDYGYRENHLPKIKNITQENKSLFDLASERDS